MEEAVLFSVENHVATITLNRPKSLNSNTLRSAYRQRQGLLRRRRPAVFGSIARCRCPPCLYY